MIEVPEHLKEHIAIQDYSQYTDIDHASWRYIMRVSKKFFKKHAHKKYMDGLEETGITTDYIPQISEMDQKLRKFGWRAVTVTGFIPPAVFLEFQSLGILPIACDMRRLEHLEYTPSPDIVHEAAGHAPIIADKGYASYLKKFGEIARKVIFAKEDIAVYEAIKYLSDIKESADVTEQQIQDAYQKLDEAYKKLNYVSEASQLSRLGWWTIEYGLVKAKNEYKIYGAGLLSSVEESYSAIKGRVKKVPLTIKCIEVDYDITKPQPQLFYVKNFSQLKSVINQLAKRMSYTVGGLESLKRAQRAGTITTTVFESGIQISGVLHNIILSKNKPAYLQFQGASQLAYNDVEIEGHSAQYHSHGFGTPIGKIVKIKKPPQNLTGNDLARMGFKNGQKGQLEFESGVVISGVLKSTIKKKGKNILLSFTECKVTYKNKVLFEPSWGVFDMACGTKVISVFGGAADRAAYLKAVPSQETGPKRQTSNMTEDHKDLLPLYQKIRKMREQKYSTVGDLIHEVQGVIEQLDKKYPKDWLLRLEIIELLKLKGSSNKVDTEFQNLLKHVEAHLNKLAQSSQTLATLISRGLELL